MLQRLKRRGNKMHRNNYIDGDDSEEETADDEEHLVLRVDGKCH